MNRYWPCLVVLLVTLLSLDSFGSSRLKDLFKDKTRIENPFDLRDPFKPPLRKSSSKRSGMSTRQTDGVYTNIPPLGNLNIADLRVVGVIIGKDRRALVRQKESKEITVLREGMRIGKDNAELKAIHPGGIILVEKLVNVYGEEEYLETVIPISQ